MTLEWNAGDYETLADPMTRWGGEFLGRLDLRGDETVVDAGCGTGRVTGLLLERLPEGRVIAVDGSRAMVEATREKFAGDERVRVSHQNLLELRVDEPVDVIFSTATFHWIPDHDRLFGRLFSALKPGGLLAAQCGGEGNISRVREATAKVVRSERFRTYFEKWEENKEYASAETARTRLEGAGFKQIQTWLHEEPTEFGSVGDLARYLQTIILRGHMEALPENEHEPFAFAVAEGMEVQDGPLLADYVRLNMLARRPAEGQED